MNLINKANCKKGQGMVEYIILVALVAIAAIGITEILGQTVRIKLAEITSGLQDKGQNRVSKQMPNIDDKFLTRKGLTTFHKTSGNANNKNSSSDESNQE